MKTFLGIFAALLLNYGQAYSQYLVNAEYLNTTPSELLGAFPGIDATMDVKYYKVTYNTVDVHGAPTVASGGMAIPDTDECNNFPMMVYCHGTVLKQYDAPSADNSEAQIAKLFSSAGFIALAPDYLGLGENPGIHPYVHDQSQATATLDLVRAAREYLSENEVNENGELFITGYSQGGHAAMGALKYAQENDLVDELGIVAGAPCSGPYNLSGTQSDVIVSDLPYSNPGYVIYTLISYQEAYGTLYANLGDVVQSPYDVDVLPYFDGAQDTYNMGAVNAILPGLMSELLVDTVLANFETNPNHPLRVALVDNDNYNWVPEIPIRIYYCDGDEQVDYNNSLYTEQWMNDNGALDVESANVSPGADHGGCVFPALIQAYDFFTSLATPCESTNEIEDYPVLALDVHPNPAQTELVIQFPEQIGNITIQDILGNRVYSAPIIQSEMRVDISKFSAGTYIVSVQNESLVRRTRIVVQ